MVRQVGEDLRGYVDGVALILGHQARDAASTGVLLGSAEARLVQLALDYLWDHVRAAHEHLTVLGPQNHEVGQARGKGADARYGAQYD